MHLDISNLFTDSLKSLKYAINHPDKFDHPHIAYMIAFSQLFASALFEYINIQILFSRVNVYFTLICHITVDLLAKMQQFYYKTVKDSPNIPSHTIFDE